MTPQAPEQLALVRSSVRRAAPRPAPSPAAVAPVARVAVDVSLPHLDRLFDYLVTEDQDAAAVPGARVKVRFAGALVGGFVVERVESSGYDGRLARLTSVVSSEPALSPELARLARSVADRYAGTLADVLRLAVPPRHARVEAEAVGAGSDGAATHPEVAGPAPSGTDQGPWTGYDAGPAFLARLGRLGAPADGPGPRAVWTALPGEDWPDALAVVAATTLAAGRGTLVVVPDARDLTRVSAAMSVRLGAPGFVALTADLGPAERYRRWLAVRRGQVRVVVGTRAAMFAPVADLGLVVVWDDGDDLHAEPRAPYPHVREVLCQRAHETGAGALVAGFARTAEGALLVASGWAHHIGPSRDRLRAAAPRVHVAGDDADLERDPAAAAARLPSVAWRAARAALAAGPVLVQVPRRGYLPALSCQQCRRPARCATCHGPLALGSGHAVAACRWCGRPAGTWACEHCGSARFRAQVVGAGRTAEELGRAFPGVPVRTSGRDAVVAAVGAEPALVVATPGAEPVAEGGYAAALLLDGWALLGRPDLRAGEEALRRWFAAAALVRPAAAGGVVVVCADPGLVPVQALVRWDPVTASDRELAERDGVGLPPAARVATVDGPPGAVDELLAALRLPPDAELLGPVPLAAQRPEDRAADRAAGRDGSRVRAVLRSPRRSGLALAAALREAQGVRSARKADGAVRVCVDPLDLG